MFVYGNRTRHIQFKRLHLKTYLLHYKVQHNLSTRGVQLPTGTASTITYLSPVCIALISFLHNLRPISTTSWKSMAPLVFKLHSDVVNTCSDVGYTKVQVTRWSRAGCYRWLTYTLCTRVGLISNTGVELYIESIQPS